MIRYRYALTIAYDGSHLYGFQTQKEGETVQSKIEHALSTTLRQEIKIQVAGRTDSGVHATGQLVSFRTNTEISEPEKFVISINALSAPYVQVTKFHYVPYDFHPRFDCIAREYEYFILQSRTPSLFLSPYVWRISDSIRLADFKHELTDLLGEHNFTAFTRMKNLDNQRKRYLDKIELTQKFDPLSGQTLYSIQIRGNAFLHNMVRILVGSFVDRAAGLVNLSLSDIIKSQDRRLAGHTAPAHALFLRTAYYPDVLELQSTGLSLIKDYPVFGDSLFKQKLLKLN